MKPEAALARALADFRDTRPGSEEYDHAALELHSALQSTQREVLTALERDNPQVVGKRSAL